MTDKELLELAAKAAGYEVRFVHINTGSGPDDSFEIKQVLYGRFEKWFTWNPILSDGDALRLSVKLRLPLYFPFTRAEIVVCDFAEERYSSFGDPYAATRRAIVRAAAATAGM